MDVLDDLLSVLWNDHDSFTLDWHEFSNNKLLV